jgi:hypothetical protein
VVGSLPVSLTGSVSDGRIGSQEIDCDSVSDSDSDHATERCRRRCQVLPSLNLSTAAVR